MKVRHGFVTNSSSSSFIISRSTEETVEDVYQMIRELYLEYAEKCSKAIEYVKTHRNKGMAYSKEKGIYIPNEYNIEFKRRQTIESNFKLCTGLEYWECCHNKKLGEIPEWVISCNTYKKYQKYWEKETKGTYKEAPFTIGDFLNPEITWLRNGGETDVIDTSYDNDVLNWYFECAEDFPGCTENFSECPLKRRHEEYDWWTDSMNESLCKKIQAAEGKQNICFEVLGRFCIYSECGYIPYWIVDRLIEMSEFSCNHMG